MASCIFCPILLFLLFISHQHFLCPDRFQNPVLKTDASGDWQSKKVVLGREYRILFYHPGYVLTDNIQTVTVGDETVKLKLVTGTPKEALPETPEDQFTYKVLNGTYCQITGYTGSDTAITIPGMIDGYIVQKLADKAFKDNKTLTAVAFAETIETMGSEVFCGCSSLADVRLNDGLTNIGGNAFDQCRALEKIDIPATVKTLGIRAFVNCTALKEVDLKEGLITIGAYAFENAPFESLRLPDSITTMGARAFYNCVNLTKINFPLSWTTTLDQGNDTYWNENDNTYQSPFQGCTGITSFEIPEGVTIENEAWTPENKDVVYYMDGTYEGADYTANYQSIIYGT